MKKLAAVLMLVIGIESAVAADQLPADVRGAVNEYTIAMQKDGLAAAAKFMHPEALGQFKQSILESMASPGLGDAVLRRAFGESVTLEGARAMPPAEFVAKFFASNREKDVGKMIVSNDIIGAVKEGDLWHVITRTRAEVLGSRVTSVSVTTLKRDGATWKALLASTTEPLPGAQSGFQRPEMRSEPPPPPPPPPPPRVPGSRN